MKRKRKPNKTCPLFKSNCQLSCVFRQHNHNPVYNYCLLNMAIYEFTANTAIIKECIKNISLKISEYDGKLKVDNNTTDAGEISGAIDELKETLEDIRADRA